MKYHQRTQQVSRENFNRCPATRIHPRIRVGYQKNVWCYRRCRFFLAITIGKKRSCWLFIFLLTDDLGKCACASLAYFEIKDVVQKFRPCLPVCFIEGRAERKIEKRHLQCHSLLKETLSVNNATSIKADYLWFVALAPSCAPVTYQSRSLKLHGLLRGHLRETCSLICLSTPVRTIYCAFPC